VALLFLFKLTGSAAEGWRVLEITRPFRGLIYIKRPLTFLNPYPLFGGFLAVQSQRFNEVIEAPALVGIATDGLTCVGGSPHGFISLAQHHIRAHQL
jgi:hypothetical protein